MTSPEIAEKLFISVRTVQSHRANIMEKLGVKNTAELIRYALSNGDVPPRND
jgi:DNA-binding CsgD family transcriptional regulator